MPLVFALTLAALLTAMLSSVAGMGGGTILIGLLYMAGLSHTQAIPLFSAVQFITGVSRTSAYFRHVEWRATGWFLLGTGPTSFLVAPYVAKANVHCLELLLAALIMVSLLPGKANQPVMGPRASFFVAGLLNGSLGMFVGATGLFLGRLYLRPEWKKETTIGTLALTLTLGHVARVLGYGLAGYSALADWHLLLPLAVAVVLGTFAGKWLNGKVSEAQFRTLVTTILWVESAKLLFDGLTGLGTWPHWN